MPRSRFAELWTLDPAVDYLNHGSFGACPRAVQDFQRALAEELEREPADFLVRRLPGRLAAAREALAAAGVAARVVSMPCREWFDAQDQAYRDTVIPPTTKARVSVEAGIAQGWRDVVGDHGRIVSIDHYGASADFARIYEEFAITGEAVANAARDSLRTLTD